MMRADLSQRAGHPPSQLLAFHGSLFDIKCTNGRCNWIQHGNRDDPFCPALSFASADYPEGQKNPILDADQPIPHVSADELPRCPKCSTGLQRPGVVWFGENLDTSVMDRADEFVNEEQLVCMTCSRLIHTDND